MHNPSQNGNYKLKRNCLVSKWGINTLYSYLHIYKAVNKAGANSAICSSLIATTSKFQDFPGTNSFFHALEDSEKIPGLYRKRGKPGKKEMGKRSLCCSPPLSNVTIFHLQTRCTKSATKLSANITSHIKHVTLLQYLIKEN